MNNIPLHPGIFVLLECLQPRELTVTEAADGLGVTRNTLSRLIHGRHGVSADMALRLSQAFGGTAELWLERQMAFDLARARIGVDAESIRRFESPLRLQRGVVRKMRLSASGEDELSLSTPAERLAAMWQLAQDAWVFKKGSHAESRLPRSTVHILRREG